MSESPLRVRVRYVRSLGATTEADLTLPHLPPVVGMILHPPRVGARLIVWRGARAIMRSTLIQHVEEGAGRSWEVTTVRSVYRVRVVPAAPSAMSPPWP